MAQSSSAYNFSLFEPLDYGSAAPQLEPDYEPEELPAKPRTKKKKSAQSVTRDERKATVISLAQTAKALAVILFVFALICVAMYLNARLDETAREINSIESQLKTAQSEYIRLSSALEGMVAIDRVENYAENNLGMVKLENYKITYFAPDDTNQVVISGGKSYSDSDAGSKLSALKEYLFN